MSRSQARTQEVSVSQLGESDLSDVQLQRLKELMDTDFPLQAATAASKLQLAAKDWDGNVSKSLLRAYTLMAEAAEEVALACADGENDEDQEVCPILQVLISLTDVITDSRRCRI